MFADDTFYDKHVAKPPVPYLVYHNGRCRNGRQERLSLFVSDTCDVLRKVCRRATAAVAAHELSYTQAQLDTCSPKLTHGTSNYRIALATEGCRAPNDNSQHQPRQPCSFIGQCYPSYLSKHRRRRGHEGGGDADAIYEHRGMKHRALQLHLDTL